MATQWNVETVTFNRADGVGETTIKLNSPVLVRSDCASAYTVCRMAVARMPLAALEKVILCMLIDDSECGYRQYSYADIAKAMDKGVHSIERAVAALRKEGLIITTRVGRSDAAIAFSCDAFICWGAKHVSPQAPAAVQVETSVTSENLVDSDGVFRSKTHEKAPRKPHKKPVAKKEFTVPLSECPPVEMPSCVPVAVGNIGMGWMESDVDASEERKHTIAVSVADDDDDVISFGSDTAETDIGHGVVMNPDL